MGTVSPRSAGHRLPAAFVSLALLAAGGLISVFYFPAAAPLGMLKSSGRRADFFLLLTLAIAVVAATANPAGIAVFAAAACACIAAPPRGRPEDYFRTLFAGFFAALAAMLAGGWMFSFLDSAEIFRTISKIFLFSLAGNAEMMADHQPAQLAEKAFRIVPAMALILLAAGYFLNLVFIGIMTGKRTSFGRASKAVPVSVYLLSLALALNIAQKYFLASYVAENLLTASVFLFFVSGCGIIWSILMRMGAGRFLSAVMTALFVFIWPAAAGVGVMGRCIKFKRKGRE